MIGLQVLTGPTPTVALQIPSDPALLGVSVYTQAALFAITLPLRLTNSLQLVLGE